MISIAICTKNRASLLEENLNLLLSKLKNNKDRWEVLIIDSSSGKKTRRLTESYKKRYLDFSLRYYFEKKQGISFARNTAVKKSKGRVIVFIDDDIFISEDWLTEIKKALRKFPKAAIIGGRILPLNPLPKNKKWLFSLKGKYDFWSLTLLDKGNKTKILNNDYLLMSANLVIRKKFFDSAGGFNENFATKEGFLKIFGGEDIDFVQRTIKKGYQVVYCSKLLVFHKIFPYKLTKSWFRWRYFENGKEIANFDRIHRKEDKAIYRCWKLAKDLPLDIKRVLSEYFLKRPQNFYHETHFFYILGYLLANVIFFLKKLDQ